MTLAVDADLPDIRTMWNLLRPNRQAADTWRPPGPTFIERNVGGDLIAFLISWLQPHPADDQLEPMMWAWYVDTSLPLADRERLLWTVALEMAEYYRLLGYQRTFGRPDELTSRFVKLRHSGFTEFVSDRGTFVIADDRAETMGFLSDEAAVI